MFRLILGLAAILADSSLAAPTPADSASLEIGFPSFPPLPQFRPLPPPPPILTSPSMVVDDHDRAQARSVLDDMLSQFPTLVDGVAGLMKTQQLLSSPNLLQNVGLPGLSQPTGSLRGLPSLPGLPAFSLPNAPESANLASPSTLSTLIDGFLGNLREIAASPLQFAPLRLTPPGGTPIVNAPLDPSPLFDTRSLLPQPQSLTAPIIVSVPNEQGLSTNELIESLKRRVSDLSPPGSNGALDSQLILGPLLNVIDVKPLSPENPPKKPVEYSTEPVRRTLPGSLLGGKTEVQIFLTDPNQPQDQATDARMALTEAQRSYDPRAFAWA